LRFNSENSWISDGLPSSSRRRKRGKGRGEGGEWREKGSAMEVYVEVDGAKKEIKVKRRRTYVSKKTISYYVAFRAKRNLFEPGIYSSSKNLLVLSL